MSIDRSLKLSGIAAGQRSVLKRHERIDQMKLESKWQDGRSVYKLPKLKVAKFSKKKK